MKTVKKILNSKYFMFTITTIISFCFIYYYDLLQGLDAKETWKVIETFFSNEKYYSYVMYKGLYAFVPGIISYYVGELFGISTFLILKMMHALSFAYLATIGVPFLIKKLFNYEVKIYQIYLFSIVYWILEFYVFIFLSVDFWSLLILVLSINQLFKIKDDKSHKKYRPLILGIMLGICSGLSGQYSISALILITYFIYFIIKSNKNNFKILAITLIIFSIGYTIIKIPDKIYENVVVEDGRKNGKYIPTGTQWLIHGLSANMLVINFPAELPDNLSMSIVANLGDEAMSVVKSRADYFTPDIYFKTFLHKPVEFIVKWTERLFLGLMNDPFSTHPINNPYPLYTICFMAISIYLTYNYVREHAKKIKSYFGLNTCIFLTFLFPSLIASFGHVEARYFLALRTLFIASLVLSPIIPNIINKLKNKKNKGNVNYVVFETFAFVLICIILFLALYQSQGVDSSNLFNYIKPRH